MGLGLRNLEFMLLGFRVYKAYRAESGDYLFCPLKLSEGCAVNGRQKMQSMKLLMGVDEYRVLGFRI